MAYFTFTGQGASPLAKCGVFSKLENKQDNQNGNKGAENSDSINVNMLDSSEGDAFMPLNSLGINELEKVAMNDGTVTQNANGTYSGTVTRAEFRHFKTELIDEKLPDDHNVSPNIFLKTNYQINS